MEKNNRTNGKENLTKILNFMLSGGDQTIEIINLEGTDYLLTKLEEKVNNADLNSKKLTAFTQKNLELFKSRFGLYDNSCFKTYEEVADEYNTTSNRVVAAEAKGLRELIGFYRREEKQQEETQKHRR